MRLTRDTAPLIIGLGHKARSGKSEVSRAMFGMACTDYDVLQTSFAKALRTEVRQAIDSLWSNGTNEQDRVMELCLMSGVDYDPKAVASADYPYGKQRALYQFWGTEFRRADNPFYWVEQVEQEILSSKPQLVIIDDVRFPNELFWVRAMGGFTVKVDRPTISLGGTAATHASETALDGFEFDYTLTSEEGKVDKLREDGVALLDHIIKKWTSNDADAFFQSLNDTTFALQES